MNDCLRYGWLYERFTERFIACIDGLYKSFSLRTEAVAVGRLA